MNAEKSLPVSQQVGEKKEGIWCFIKSALQVMETSLLLCFAHPARMHNPKCFFFHFFHSMVFSSNPKKCCAFKSPLFSLSFAPFYKPILVVLNILPAPPQFTSRKLLSAKSVGRMLGEHDLDNRAGGSIRGSVTPNQNAVHLVVDYSLTPA